MWVTLPPYTEYVQSSMAFSGQPADENVYQTCLDLFFDEDCPMKVIPLIWLRASERYGHMLRNKLEVYQIYI